MLVIYLFRERSFRKGWYEMRARPESRVYGENGVMRWWLESEPELIAWEKEYAGEADRLAEAEAIKTGRKHWGRWYLTKHSLNTVAIRPKVGEEGFYKGYTYDINLDRLSENWVEHMSAKNWIGETGLKDLAIALKVLTTSEVLKSPRLSANILALKARG